MTEARPNFLSDISLINSIEAVPSILRVVCHATSMGLAAVARVTEERWVACSVLDQIDFGLAPGGELKVETTICHEIRQSREGVIIDNVAKTELIAATRRLPGMASRAISRCRSFFGTVQCSARFAPSTQNRIA
jgi:hypothetical protein